MSTSTRSPQSPATRTMSVEEASRLLGIGRDLAYREVRETGQLAGVPVIRIGPRKVLLSRAAIERVLDGLAGDES